MSFDPKKKLREMFLKAAGEIYGTEPQEDPEVLKYASKIEKAFKGIDRDQALSMARDHIQAYGQGS